jgi:hypothetical protein
MRYTRIRKVGSRSIDALYLTLPLRSGIFRSLRGCASLEMVIIIARCLDSSVSLRTLFIVTGWTYDWRYEEGNRGFLVDMAHNHGLRWCRMQLHGALSAVDLRDVAAP